mmetsp:Transcript_38096/g.89239  ORF Transcript_38096/g.89239 Transcript_38096/m.89239 type:complete len:94 (+) Transcript_38096:16-297(+)
MGNRAGRRTDCTRSQGCGVCRLEPSYNYVKYTTCTLSPLELVLLCTAAGGAASKVCGSHTVEKGPLLSVAQASLPNFADSSSKTGTLVYTSAA